MEMCWNGSPFGTSLKPSDQHEVTKFSYLRSYLIGEAKAAIAGLTLTAAHYAKAKEILQNRFGRKERLIFEHIQGLFGIEE